VSGPAKGGNQFDLFGAPRPQAPLPAPTANPQLAPTANPQLAPTAKPPPALSEKALLAPSEVEGRPAPTPILSARSPQPLTDQILTVTELTSQVKNLLEGGFPRVAVSGELSNCRRQSSGHLYFTLKDAGATLGAVMWRQSSARLKFEAKDGIEVVCHGRLELYLPHGKYQLIAERMEPLGAGALALAFEQLKEKLEREGLFEPARKRALPFLPRRIGVVTSPTGAALRDFLRVLHLRYPALPVFIVPARVQGEGAGADVAAAIDRLSAGGEVDVVVVTRGGGSMEDLWAFNEEIVARAIARSRVPVVSAIGHEIDFTIADFVSDRRAPTPTGAAELLAPVRADLEASLLLLTRRLQRGLQRTVQERREKLLRLRFGLGDPRRQLSDRRLALAELEERLSAGLRGVFEMRRLALKQLRERTEARNPRADLASRVRSLHQLRSALERAGQRALALQGRHVALQQQRARLATTARTLLQARQQALRVASARLEAISPQRVFERGYSLTKLVRTGHLVRTASDAPPGEELDIVLGFDERATPWREESLRAVVQAHPSNDKSRK
jgi:exodeoxyribonuclease VII large subunit